MKFLNLLKTTPALPKITYQLLKFTVCLLKNLLVALLFFPPCSPFFSIFKKISLLDF